MAKVTTSLSLSLPCGPGWRGRGGRCLTVSSTNTYTVVRKVSRSSMGMFRSLSRGGTTMLELYGHLSHFATRSNSHQTYRVIVPRANLQSAIYNLQSHRLRR